ncbi:MAG TPA: hypothetical protein VF261_00260, partial [Candidatus Saccharimonadales bacterium]
TYTQTLQAGSAEVSTLTVDQALSINQSASVTGGLQAGSLEINGNAGIQGGLIVVGAAKVNLINSTTGYQFSGTNGATITCSSGQFLQNQVVQGGITTGGTCATAGGGGGITTVGTFSATSIANGASISGSTITFGPADATNPGMVTASGNQTFGGNKTFTGTVTMANLVMFGNASASNGSLLLYNATNSNTVTVQSGVTTASYSITLPTAIGTAGQCLAVSSVSSSTQTLGYKSCATSPGTQTVTLAPEFAGAIFHASGSNNSGFMTSDYIGGLAAAQGYKHNYYQWTTDQATAQNYDIIANYQLPSSFTSFASGSFKVWVYVDSTTSTGMTFMLQSNNGTSCYVSAQSIEPSATGTWQQITISDPGNGCTFAANDIVMLDFNLTAIAPDTNTVRLGELQFGYN